MLCKYCAERIGVESVGERCELCDNVFERLDEIAKRVCRELGKYKGATFRIGTVLPKDVIRKEEEIWQEFGVSESLKKHINRELGKRVSSLCGAKYHPTNPNVEVLFLFPDDIRLEVKPVYIYGRYRKTRAMPQTKWPCRYCGGKGCVECDYTGRQWKESVEYVIADVVIPLFLAKESKLHAMGREDIDAFMLGKGRPFVLEIRGAYRFDIKESTIEGCVNERERGVEVRGIRYVDRGCVKEVKESRNPKLYRVLVDCEGIEGLRLENIKIRQRTPSRLLHRKKDRERVKTVYRVEEKDGYVWILAESGTYIKEFVTGDNGRTEPSLSSLLGKDCKVIRLEVWDVGETSCDQRESETV